MNPNILHTSCGIYSITNNINGNFYIGSCINYKTRMKCHVNTLKKGRHCNIKLQRSFDKYGIDNFSFDFLEVVERDKSKIIEREQWYLDFFKPFYNIQKVAYSALGVKMSESARKNISEAAKKRKISPEGKRRISEALFKAHKGRKHTKESLDKMSKNSHFNGVRMFGVDNSFYGKKHSKESTDKMRASKINNPKVKDAVLKRTAMIKETGKFKGEGNPFFGKKHTEATKQKLREARARQVFTKESYLRAAEKKKGRVGVWKGKHLSENHKKNISLGFRLRREQKELLNSNQLKINIK